MNLVSWVTVLRRRRSVSLELTENLYEEMNGLQIRQLVVVCVHTYTEEQAGVTPVHDLVVTELLRRLESGLAATQSWFRTYLNEVRLILLVTRSH